MRLGLISDIHGNLVALEAVFRALREEGVDGCLCGGDLVGYGPMPNECVGAIAERGIPCAAGNHDLIAAGRLSTDRQSPLARHTLEWTRAVLSDEARAYLSGLPATARSDGVLAAHGSLDDPERYVNGEREATLELERAGRVERPPRVVVLGHTHRALAVGERRGLLLAQDTGTVPLAADERLVVNPGSVGQTREGRLRARFAILDLQEGALSFHALRYDGRAVRRALRRAGLPARAHHPTPSPARSAALALRRSSAGRSLGRRVRALRR